MLAGILLGAATAVLQSFSYLASAFFIRKHASALKLLISSHLLMGAAGMLLLPFCFPTELFASASRALLLLTAWIILFCLGQGGFFICQKEIESSRLASLLGLKIAVLSLIWVLFFGNRLNMLQIAGVVMCVVAAFAMNWSGGKTFTFRSLIVLALTLISFSLTDITETHMVLLADNGNIVTSGIAVTLLCYFTLGIFSLPFLLKVKLSRQMLRDALPFAALWLISQMTLLICFGMLHPVFGNVIQSSRALFSVLLGCLACRLGWNVMETASSGWLWIRRGIAALLMISGIAAFSFGKIIT